MTEKIADSLCELIGGTPLVRLSRFSKGLPGEIVKSSLRFSLGATTTEAKIDEAVGRILSVVHELRP